MGGVVVVWITVWPRANVQRYSALALQRSRNAHSTRPPAAYPTLLSDPEYVPVTPVTPAPLWLMVV